MAVCWQIRIQLSQTWKNYHLQNEKLYIRAMPIKRLILRAPTKMGVGKNKPKTLSFSASFLSMTKAGRLACGSRWKSFATSGFTVWQKLTSSSSLEAAASSSLSGPCFFYEVNQHRINYRTNVHNVLTTTIISRCENHSRISS